MADGTDKPFADMTVPELTEEWRHWNQEIANAKGWGAALAAADEFRRACETHLKRLGAWPIKEPASAAAECDAAELKAALDVISKLMALVTNVGHWAGHGCSETAAAAIREAQHDGWRAMGWADFLELQRRPKA